MGQGLRYILLVVIRVVFLFPLVWVLACSTKPENEILNYPPKWAPDTFTVSNYTTVLEKYPHLPRGTNGLIIAVCGTLMILSLLSLATYVFGYFEFRGRKLIYGAAVIMLLTSIQAYMISPYPICAKTGLLNIYVSIIFPSAANVTSISTPTSFFKDLPHEPEEAVRIGDCGEFMTFLRIMLPLSELVLFTVAISTFIADWSSFLWLMIAIHFDKILTLLVGIAQLMDSVSPNTQLQCGTALVTCCIAIIPTMIVFLLLQWYFVEGVATSGAKG